MADLPPCTCITDCGDDPGVRAGKSRPCRSMQIYLQQRADAAQLKALLADLGYPDALSAVKDLAALRAAEQQNQVGLDQAPDPLFVDTQPAGLGEEITVGLERRGGIPR